jgi:membrane protein DedA with SNARE-associated domain
MLAWITHTIDAMGYWGVFFLMFIENIVFPIPSEVIMPLAGFTAAQGGMTFPGALVAGVIGTVLGELTWYFIGKGVGPYRLRTWADRYGRWLTLSSAEIDKATYWFDRYGRAAVLFGRMVPAFNKLVSIPAGFSHMRVPSFVIYSAIGSFCWTLLLGYLGYTLGDNYTLVEKYMGPVSALVGGALLAAFAFWVFLRKRRASREG